MAEEHPERPLGDDPEIRRAKSVLFLVTVSALGLFIVVLLVFFQPEGQVFTESWPNGYRKTRTTYVSAPNREGRERHGRHEAWYESGQLRERGTYDRGVRSGTWRFWREDGTLDEASSGVFEEDVRVGPLDP